MSKNITLKEALENLAEVAKVAADLIESEEAPEEAETPDPKKGSAKTAEKKTSGKAAAKEAAPAKGRGKKAPEPEPEDEEEDEGEEMFLDPGQFEDWAHKDLKVLAKDMGLKATGDKDALIEKICAEPVTADIVEANELELADGEEGEEDEEESGEEVSQEAAEAQVAEFTEGMKLKDLKELCADNDIEASGTKKDAYISALVDAVISGEISFDEEEEESEDDEDEGEEVDPNDPEAEGQTDERIKAMKAFEKSAKASFKKGKLDAEAMTEWLVDEFGADEDDMPEDENELFAAYLDANYMFIDDEGNTIDEPGTAYLILGESYCCGSPLQEGEDGKLHCETCGEEFETE